MSGPDSAGAGQDMPCGPPPPSDTQVPSEPRALYQPPVPEAEPRYMYYRQYPGSGSPLPPPYPPPPYSAAPYPHPYPAHPYPTAMAYPPPYSAPAAPYGYLPYPVQGDKYPPAERQYYGEPPEQDQALVCTCHPHPSSAAPPAGGPAYHPAEDDDGLCAPGQPGQPGHPGHPGHPGQPSQPSQPICSCEQEPGPPPLRRSASNFSEDSLVDGAPPAPAPAPAPAPVPVPVPAAAPVQAAVVLRPGGGGGGAARQPEKRRSLTQEYLAAQAADAAGRRGSRNLEGAEPVRMPPPETSRPTEPVNGAPESAKAAPESGRAALESGRAALESGKAAPESGRAVPEERRPSVSSERRAETEREEEPTAVQQREEERPAAPAADARRLSQACDDGPAAPASDTPSRSQAYDDRPAVAGANARRLTQAYDDRPSTVAPDSRRLSQAYDDRPATATPDPCRLSEAYDDRPATATPDPRRLSQTYDDRPATATPDSRRLSQAYVERPATATPDPRRLSQAYDDRPATVAPDLRRLSQAYDDRPATATPDPRRLSQAAYDERPAIAGTDPRRLSQAYDDRTAAPAPDARRLSQAQGTPAPDPRRLSQVYDDRPVGPAPDTRRLSQAYDDRPAGPAPDTRRLSHAYDDRPAGPAPDTRRLSQAYDDRPAGPAPDTRRLSQAYDDRPAGPAPDTRRLSQAYDDRPAGPAPDTRRLSQAYDDRPAGPAPDTRRLSQAYDDRPAGPAPDTRRLSQAYDDRPAGPTPDTRRLSQAYDDRPAGPAPDARRLSLSQMYDDRPVGPAPAGRRLSQVYDDRPAQSRRLSQPLLRTERVEEASGVSAARGTSEPRETSPGQRAAPAAAPATAGGEVAAVDDRPPCQKYDDRPCTVTADAIPSVAAVKPWWEKQPDRATPQPTKARSQDSPSRRSSVDRTARGMQLPAQTTSPSGTAQRKSSPPTDSPERRDRRAAAGDAADAADSPLAFTVDFGPADKKLHVKDSISRWAPRVRRPAAAAAGKDDRDETRSDSGDLKGTGSGVPRPRSLLRRRQGAPGYHSEGYFSSDQDVDSRESSRRPAVQRQSALARTPSPRGAAGAARLAARRATVTRAPAAGSGLKKSATMGAMPRQHSAGARQEDAPDDVSEAGTYTIENEPDGEEAARQVDAAFSGLDGYGDEEHRSGGGDDSSKEGSPDRDTETSSKPSAYSSGGSNWIEQWAAEVTKHNQENLKKAQKAPSPVASTKPPTGSSSPWSRHTASPDGVGGRPRRKLPTPPGLSRSPVTGSGGDKSSPGRSAAAGGSLDTASYLRTTEDVMLALEARIDAAHTADESDSEECSSEGSEGAAGPPPPTGKPATPAAAGAEFKFNRALSLRRARLGLDAESATSGSSKRPTPPPAPRPSSGGGRKLSDSESGPPVSGSGKAGFARSDGGRFSLRMANGNTKTPPSRPSAARKVPGSGAARPLGGGPRAAAQAAQASRDQEMANWKRRKNYDPLKAAKEARNKKVEPRGGSQSDSACATAAPLRSASFHGTDGFGPALLRRAAFAAGSEDESAARRRAPLVSARSSAAAAHRLGHDDSDVSEVFHDGASAASSTRKVSLDGSRRSRGVSPLFRGPAPASLKNKVKLEALDNLVISTIHTLSSKIRGNSESLVSKLKCQFDEEDVRHTLLDDVMTTLTTDAPSASKASSRDLAGILKNLRKVEQAVQVLEQVLCDDDCDVSDDGDELDAADKFGDGFY